MKTEYRGYEIEVRPTRCDYMTVWVFRVRDGRGRLAREDDGGFTAEDAVRSARRAIDRM